MLLLQRLLSHILSLRGSYLELGLLSCKALRSAWFCHCFSLIVNPWCPHGFQSRVFVSPLIVAHGVAFIWLSELMYSNERKALDIANEGPWNVHKHYSTAAQAISSNIWDVQHCCSEWVNYGSYPSHVNTPQLASGEPFPHLCQILEAIFPELSRISIFRFNIFPLWLQVWFTPHFKNSRRHEVLDLSGFSISRGRTPIISGARTCTRTM